VNPANRSDFESVDTGYTTKLCAGRPVAECRLAHCVVDIGSVHMAVLQYFCGKRVLVAGRKSGVVTDCGSEILFIVVREDF